MLLAERIEAQREVGKAEGPREKADGSSIGPEKLEARLKKVRAGGLVRQSIKGSIGGKKGKFKRAERQVSCILAGAAEEKSLALF